LVQSIIGQHPDFCVFPEPNVLYWLVGNLDRKRFGNSIRWDNFLRGEIKKFLNFIGVCPGFYWGQMGSFRELTSEGNVIPSYLEGREVFTRVAVNKYARFMESLSGQKRWVDKSPQNVFALALIQKYFPSARFIHIVRDEKDNIASIVDASKKYEDFSHRFGGTYGIDRAINFYNHALFQSVKYMGKRRHLIIRYEDLVQDPETVMERVGCHLGVTFCRSMLRYDTQGIASSAEVWKRNDKGIVFQKSKFETALTSEEKEAVKARAVSADKYFPREG